MSNRNKRNRDVYGGVIENNQYIEFKNCKEAHNYISNFFKEVKDIVRVGDVHKVVDYGNDLEGSDRDQWKEFVTTSFDFLLSYIGGPGGGMFKNLIALSKELNMTIFLSYKRGSGDNRNNYHDFGSKAWYLKAFAKECLNTRFYLFDDGTDHIASVNALNNRFIVGILVTYENDKGFDIYGQMSATDRKFRIQKALTLIK